MKTKTTVYVMLFMLLIQNSFAQKDEFYNIPENTVAIHLDNVAFDEDDYMEVLDSDNHTIAYYDRFENKSAFIRSVKVYNLDKELIYTLVPLMSDQGYEIHIKNQDGQRGFVGITGHLQGFRAVYESQVSYFEEPYNFDFIMRAGIGKVSAKQAVNYQGQEVMTYETKVGAFSKIKITPLLVDKTFFEAHKMDVANWALIIQLIKELSLETARNNNVHRQSN